MGTGERARRPGPAVVLVLVMLVAGAACGDRASSDPRPGYTKSPLENPGLTIEAEPSTAMDSLGTPNLEVPDTQANYIAPVPIPGSAPAAGSGASGSPAGGL